MATLLGIELVVLRTQNEHSVEGAPAATDFAVCAAEDLPEVQDHVREILLGRIRHPTELIEPEWPQLSPSGSSSSAPVELRHDPISSDVAPRPSSPTP